MCPHCEASVKKALESIEGVTVQEVSHKKDRAVVLLAADIDDAVLTGVITEAGYEVVKIK